MSLTQREEMQSIVVRNAGTYCFIECQCSVIVEDADGNIVASQRKNHNLMPNADVSECTAQVQAVAAAVFTDEVVAAYEAIIAPPVEE